jgi:acetyl esterase/lipase
MNVLLINGGSRSGDCIYTGLSIIKEQFAQNGVDPEAVIVAGDSSGGHTAMFCGIVEDDSGMDDVNLFPGVAAKIKGIVNYYGAVSLTYDDGFPSTINHGFKDSPEGMLMGKVNLREHLELRERVSVECYIAPELAITPTLIFHGQKTVM